MHKNGVLKYLFTQVFGVIHLYFPLQSQRSKQTPNKGVCWHKASQNRQLNIWNIFLRVELSLRESSCDTLFGFVPCNRRQSIINNGLMNLLLSSTVRIWTEYNLKHITSSLWLHLMVGLFMKFGSCGAFCSKSDFRYQLKKQENKTE